MRVLALLALWGCGPGDKDPGGGGGADDTAGENGGENGGDNGGDSGGDTADSGGENGGDSGGDNGGGDTGPDPDADDDGDGLPNVDEEEWGTDPQDPDSDGDGYSDGDEAAGGTNPAYEYSHPYEQGGYHVGFCDTPPSPTGPSSEHDGWPLYVNGDVADNFTLRDQYGQEVSLYSFCGQNVMAVFAASW